MAQPKQDTLGAVNDVTEELSASDAVTGHVGFQITGTFTATITFEGTINGTDWQTVAATKREDLTAAPTATAPGLFVVDMAGLLKTRARMSAWTSGAALVNKQVNIG